MFDTTTWFAFGIIIILLFAILSNTSSTGLQAIQTQFYIISCSMPIGNGVDFLNGTINYNVDINGNPATIGEDVGSTPIVGTYYVCSIDPVTESLTVSTAIKEYGATCFSVFPCGWFGYIQDWIGKGFEKVTAFFALVLFFLTPINFNILGYTLDDMGGFALMVIIGIYAFAYLGIGIFIAGFVIGLIKSVF